MLPNSMRITFLLGFFLLWPSLPLCSGKETEAKVSGTVIMVVDKPIRVGGAFVTIAFRSSDGETVRVLPNENGEYEAVLEGGKTYTATLLSNGLCSIHRPAFRVKPGQMLRFDFTTTFCSDIDITVLDRNVRFSDTNHVLPPPSRDNSFYDEETISIGASVPRSLIIGFGIFSKGYKWKR